MRPELEDIQLLEAYLQENEEIIWSAQPFYNGGWRSLVKAGAELIASIVIIGLCYLAWSPTHALAYYLAFGEGC